MGTRHNKTPAKLLIVLVVVALALSAVPAQALAAATAGESSVGPSAPAGIAGSAALRPKIAASLRTSPAVHIPESYVLRTITCDTEVYDAAGGSSLPGLLIKAGQTWFVNPKPNKVDGVPWTRIFLGGRHTAWIPTACVGDAPPGF